MTLDLSGKTAIVTGSSKGIGYAIAESLIDCGANVVVSARNVQEVERAAGRLNERGGGQALGISCDVGEYIEVAALVERTVADFGGLDILVNNAGVGAFGPVEDIDIDTWDNLIATNLTGVFYCCHQAIPRLRERGGGWIINIASLAGKNPFAGGAAYNASKFGLVGFSEAMMLDVREHGIRVNYIMPGSVNTDFAGPGGHAAGPENDWMIQPEDIAELVVDLLRMPSRTLPSRIEVRPARVKKK
jgi:3-oxoacyl-[acyl-carrier protein] reductase